MFDEPIAPQTPTSLEAAGKSLTSGWQAAKRRRFVRFVMAVLGSIPWVGGLIAASAALNAEHDQDKINDLQRLWLEDHKRRLADLKGTVEEVVIRLDGMGEEVRNRIESPEYLALVRRVFRLWDEADTDEKKQMLKKLITNAGAMKLCSDDLIRLFALWVEQYDETHFKVMREIYKDSGITRSEIWKKIDGRVVRDNSPEADLFRYLIRDLSTGGVIRQARSTDPIGRFLKRPPKAPTSTPSGVMESAFENTKPYVLTELGKQFVHYVMEDVVPELTAKSGSQDEPAADGNETGGPENV